MALELRQFVENPTEINSDLEKKFEEVKQYFAQTYEHYEGLEVPYLKTFFGESPTETLKNFSLQSHYVNDTYGQRGTRQFERINVKNFGFVMRIGPENGALFEDIKKIWACERPVYTNDGIKILRTFTVVNSATDVYRYHETFKEIAEKCKTGNLRFSEHRKKYFEKSAELITVQNLPALFLGIQNTTSAFSKITPHLELLASGDITQFDPKLNEHLYEHIQLEEKQQYILENKETIQTLADSFLPTQMSGWKKFVALGYENKPSLLPIFLSLNKTDMNSLFDAHNNYADYIDCKSQTDFSRLSTEYDTAFIHNLKRGTIGQWAQHILDSQKGIGGDVYRIMGVANKSIK